MRTDFAAITGLGTLGSFGAGPEALAKALAAGQAAITALADPSAYRRPRAVTQAALCRAALDRWLDAGRARRMSLPSCLAVAAARMALERAGLPMLDEAQTRSVAMATTFGAGVFTEKILTEIVDSGPRTVSPFLFTDCVANAPAGQVAIDVHATGANSTVVQREAGPLLALMEGARDVCARRSDLCLAGHVDEIGVLVHAVLDRMHALCPADPDGVLRPRPFGRHRRGFVAGEGCSVVVIEPVSAARARGATILARIVAMARAFDPTAPRADWGAGSELLAARLRACLQHAELAPTDIDGVVSGASGSVRGDALEARVLRALFGPHMPPVFAPKAVTGEYGGGNLGAALLILNGAASAVVTPLSAVDPELGVVLHAGALPTRAKRVLVSGLAAGGAAAWVVLERDGT